MIDLLLTADSELTKGMQLMRDEIASRGWSARSAYLGSPHCFIDRGDGKPIHVFNTTPPTTSYASAHLADNKYATYQLLRDIGAHQLETAIVKKNIAEARELLSRVGKVVVKPIDGSHGNGITVGVMNDEALEQAIGYARQFTRNSTDIIVQQHFPHDKMYDLRLACVDGRFIGAIWRVPARVYGDGNLTVKELIENENKSSRRGVAYHAPLAAIDSERAEKFLADTYDIVPAKDQEVQVLGIANYGAGGEIIDVTDDIPDWMAREAEKISLAAGLYVCGVDYAVSRSPQPNLKDSELNVAAIEINKCPSLSIHDLPTQGKSRGAVKAYVDYLARIPSVS